MKSIIKLSYLFLLVPLTSFNKINEKKFVCTSSYKVINASNTQTITEVAFLANGYYKTHPNDFWNNSYDYTSPIPPNNEHSFANTNPYEYTTIENTVVFSSTIYTGAPLQGIIEMYHDGVLVKSVTEGAASTTHMITYKIQYGCKIVEIILRDQ